MVVEVSGRQYEISDKDFEQMLEDEPRDTIVADLLVHGARLVCEENE